MAKAPTKTAPAKAKADAGKKPVTSAEIKSRIMRAAKKAAGATVVKKAAEKKPAPEKPAAATKAKAATAKAAKPAQPAKAKKPAKAGASAGGAAKALQAEAAKAKVAPVAEPTFRIGQKVTHGLFGGGTVKEVKGDILTIEFKKGDVRHIREDFVSRG